jgi:integrase
LEDPVAQKLVGLTDAKIQGLKAVETGRYEIADEVVGGLYLRVGASGSKTFVLRKRIGGRAGKVYNVTLGRYHDKRFTLGQARKKARELLNDIEGNGAPPVAAARPRTGLAGETVKSLFADFKKEKASNRSLAAVEQLFVRHVFPVIGDRLADSVTRGEITRLIDRVANGGDRPRHSQARNVAANLSSFYSWAMPRLDRLEANPCRDAGKPKKAPSRDRVLNEAELKSLWTALGAEAPRWRDSIRMLILTGQRREEVYDADLAEFDLAARLWTIPPERAKNGKEHFVPLAPAVVALVEARPESESPKLFPSRTIGSANGMSGFSKVLARLQAAMAKDLGVEVPHWTLHDLRRTMATGLQRLGIRLEVTEAVLNHISGTTGGLVRVYQRYSYLEEKRHALEAWAADVARIVEGKPVDNVIALRSGQRP